MDSMDSADPQRNEMNEAGQPGGERRPRWHPLARIALYLVAVVLLLQILIGGPVFVLWMGLTGQDLEGDPGAPFRAENMLVVYAALAPLTVIVTLWFLRILDRRSPQGMAARLPAGGARRVFAQAFWGGAATILFLAAWLVLVSIPGTVEWGGWSTGARSGPWWWTSPSGSAVVGVLLLLGFIVQGGMEEWIVRGYVYHNLRDRWSWPTAAALSAILFAIGHGLNPEVTPPSIMNTFLIGLVLAMAVEATRSLWLPVILHGFWNFLLGCILAQPVSGIRAFGLVDLEISGPAIWTGGDYGPEASLLQTVLLLPLTIILARILDRSGRRRSAG